MQINDSEILITGGTGSLGKTLTAILLKYYTPKGIRIFSRDELKQWEMRQNIDLNFPGSPVSFLIGDIRDLRRLARAMQGVRIIINAAAMKQVPACEYNPCEAIKTNIDGVSNIIEASICHGIKKVMHVSTDKAVDPCNLYGSTKMVAEKLIINANNNMTGGRFPHFSCVRYGNVLGSRGSIIPLFKKQYDETGEITITDKRCTRFWVSLPRVAKFLLNSIESMTGGEIFIPRMGTKSIIDIAKIVAPNAWIKYIGLRKGEKVHEILITREESQRTRYYENGFFKIQSDSSFLTREETFSYASDRKDLILSNDEIKQMIEEKI